MADIDVAQGATHDRVWESTGFRLSWGAIFAGVVIATVLQVVFSLLGVGLGFLGWDPGDPLANLGIGAAIWTGIAGIVSLFIGGLTTGRLAGVLTRGDGALHGVVMWGLATLLALWLIWGGFSFLLGNALGIVGNTVSTTAGAVASGAVQVGAAAVGQIGDIDPAALQGEVEEALRQTGNPELRPDSLAATAGEIGAAATSEETNRALAGDLASEIERTAGQVRRQDLINIIAARTDLSPPEADRLVGRVETLAQRVYAQAGTTLDTLGAQVERTAGAVADDVEDALVKAAWSALLMMGLTLVAAVAGAAMTARE
ncbi:hypothetical protein BH23GEM4_BH23GEM4_17330 [soil metagenome]